MHHEYPQCTSLWIISVLIFDCLCAWKGDHLCAWKGDYLCWTWGGWVTIDTERINIQLLHAEAIAFSHAETIISSSKSWLLILSVNCQSAPSRINRGDYLFMCRGDYLFTHRGNCLFMHRGNQLAPHRINRGDDLFTCRGNHLFTWKLTVGPLWQLLIGPSPGSTEAITFSHAEAITFSCVKVVTFSHAEAITFPCIEVITFSCKNWLLILSAVIIDCSPGSTEAIAFSHAEVITFSCREVIAFSCVEAITFSWREVITLSYTEVITCSCKSWLLILSVAIADQPPPQDQKRQSPFHVQRWSPFHVQRQSPFHMEVKVDCWSSLCQLLIPPGSTEVIAFSCRGESWLLILSAAPQHDQQTDDQQILSKSW